MHDWTDGQRDEDVGAFVKFGIFFFFLFLFFYKKQNKQVLNYFHNTKNVRLIILSLLVGGFYSMGSITYLDHCSRKQHDSHICCLH